MTLATLRTALGRRRTPEQQPVPEWASLHRGNCVEVWSEDSFLYLGFVDDRADDGQLIWVFEDGTGSRHLFLRDDPISLYSI
jgi:hypothetical protein